MKKVLIINLEGAEEVYTSALLIGSIQAQYPNAMIDLLVTEKTEAIASSFNSVHKIHVINTARIKQLVKNQIFSNALAITSFYKDIKPVKESNWEIVINYSDTPLGNYICSYLTYNDKNCKTVGSRIASSGTVEFVDDWSFLCNKGTSTLNMGPVHKLDYMIKSLAITWHPSKSILKTNPQHDLLVRNNINSIRKRYSTSQTNIEIVAIYFDSKKTLELIKFTQLLELLGDLLDDPSYYPLVIIPTEEEDRIYAQEINKHFDHAISIIEADVSTLPSVVSNCDIIISANNIVNKIANLQFIPLIALNSYYDDNDLSIPVLKNDFIISAMPSHKITNFDILCALKCQSNERFEQHSSTSKGVAIRRVCRDQVGTYLSYVAGDVEGDHEIARIMSRIFLASYFNFQNNGHLYTEALKYSNEHIRNWITREKEIITELTRDLLGTLRSLIASTNSSKAASEFISYLDKIISYAEINSIVAIASNEFINRLNQLQHTSTEQNKKQMELLLYNLKMRVQSIVSSLQNLEQQWNKAQEETLTNKNSRSVQRTAPAREGTINASI